MCPKRKWSKGEGESYFDSILPLPTLSKVVFLSSPGNPPNSDSATPPPQLLPCWSTINQNNTNFFLPSIPNSTFNRFDPSSNATAFSFSVLVVRMEDGCKTRSGKNKRRSNLDHGLFFVFFSIECSSSWHRLEWFFSFEWTPISSSIAW